MTIHAVAIHHTHHPQVFYASKILEDQLLVLVAFPHLRNEASSGLKRKFFNDFLSVFLFLVIKHLEAAWACVRLLDN